MASPPPLRHPVPTHPAYIPEPPATPVSPDGYQRYASSPAPGQQQQQQNQHYQQHPQHHQQHQQQQQQSYPSHVPQQYSQQQGPAYLTSPFGHNQHSNTHGGPGQNQYTQQGSFVPQPDLAAWGLNDATTQLGMQLGSSAVAAGQEYVQKNFGGRIPIQSIKQHFNVSNSYVLRKLQLIVFPWSHKTWSRKAVRTENGQTEWQSPREDVNSPDLYIPLMAVVTYVLLAALYTGLNQRFHPKFLGEYASSAMAVVIVDFLFVYVGCYLLNVQSSGQVVDIIAYGGYKFVGVIFTVLSRFPSITTSSTVYYIVFLYFFLANALFLLRSLRSLVLPDAANSTSTAVSPAHRRRRITFLFFEAILQIVYMFWLSRV